MFDVAPGIETASGPDAGASRTRESACALSHAYEPARACRRERGLQGRFLPPPWHGWQAVPAPAATDVRRHVGRNPAVAHQ